MNRLVTQLSVHMGGGVGKAISGLALNDHNNTHIIVLLQKPEKINNIQKCLDDGIQVLICPTDNQLFSTIEMSDVVIVNWWHHPLLYTVLQKISSIRTRVILWSHVNGLFYPYLHSNFINLFDYCMFTSKASFNNPSWNETTKKTVLNKSAIILGMGDFDPITVQYKKSYKCGKIKKIGLVGTLDYSKLHPEFIKWINKLLSSRKDIKIMLIGEPSSELSYDINKNNLDEDVLLLGYRDDVPSLLPTFDLFIYPLNPLNYATTENALIEAMAAGLPIVVSDGIVEKSIINDNDDGILVSDSTSFSQAINNLLNNDHLRKKIGSNARKNAIVTYNKKTNMDKFNTVIDKLMTVPKTVHDFTAIVGADPFNWFLNGCDEPHKQLFLGIVNDQKATSNHSKQMKLILSLEHIFKSQSKGSLIQYHNAYPENSYLKMITDMIEKSEGDH